MRVNTNVFKLHKVVTISNTFQQCIPAEKNPIRKYSKQKHNLTNN